MTQSTNNTTDTIETPPSFQPPQAIELVSVEDSKVTGVSVYTGRAEVTRLFKIDVRVGQNQVTINGLPNVLDQDSFRVEGRGAATIHDVTISNIPEPDTSSTSPTLKILQAKKDRTLKALQRCKKSIESVEAYLATLNIQHIETAKLSQVVADYDATAEQLDERTLELEQKLSDIEEEIDAERVKLRGTTVDKKLNLRATIGVFADSAGEVEIVLIYAVHGASWDALYDIRVDMHTKEKPVTLIYKAAITQSTGEDWTDVPITLETATPTFGVGLPTLHPWNLSIYRPSPNYYGSARPMSSSDAVDTASAFRSAPRAAAPPPPPPPPPRSAPLAPMTHRGLTVSSKGNISATFEVPGLLSIPSDGAAHNVTIVQLHLDAAMSWVCVPKKDARMHLNAKIKNASEYTLLQGNASVYVDGSFISKTLLPSVSADESFDCSLGLDPSIRVTYHPRATKASKSGFYNKSDTQVMSQIVTLFNTKSTAVHDVKIIEQVPVSQDASITVKLVNPALPAGPVGEKQTLVSREVVAQWHGADEPGTDLTSLGKDGKFNWVCSVPPQKKLNLVLQWEIGAPTGANIVGLRDELFGH